MYCCDVVWIVDRRTRSTAVQDIMNRPGPEQLPEMCNSLMEFVQRCLTASSPIQEADWIKRYFGVYSLCMEGYDWLQKLYVETRQCLKDHVRNLYTSVSSCGNENLLDMYHRHWQEFRKVSSMLNDLYFKLNRALDTSKSSPADLIEGQLLHIGELALHIWEQHMIQPLKQSLVKVLLEEMHAARSDSDVNAPHSIINAIMHSFIDVESYKKCPARLYEELIETSFLQATAEHCKSVVLNLMDLDCIQFMKKTVSIVNDEVRYSRNFLHPNSYEKVKSECHLRLMEHRLEFLKSECKDIVRMEKRQELNQMFQLMLPFPDSLKVLITEMELHIKQTGQNAVKELKDNITTPTQFVEAILKVHGSYTDFIKEVFNGDYQFIGALDRGLAGAVNANYDNSSVCKAPEWLAKYCDSLLKKNTKMVSEMEIELSQFMTVFQYIEDKDVYQRFYAQLLARRLIKGLSRSMGAEEAMISRLTQSCGHSFTYRLQCMCKDIRLSLDLNQKFYDSKDNRFPCMFKDLSVSSDVNEKLKDSDENFSIKVLQAWVWPVSKIVPSFAVPQLLKRCISRFETFYGTQHNSRRLTWVHTLCSAEVKFLYLKKPYVMTMSALQMAVLLPYESQDTLTVKELESTTQLPKKELLKQIQSLVDSKMLVRSILDSNNPETASFSLNSGLLSTSAPTFT